MEKDIEQYARSQKKIVMVNLNARLYVLRYTGGRWFYLIKIHILFRAEQ